MSILLLNAGSSSLKAMLAEDDGRALAHAHADWAGAQTNYRMTLEDEKPRAETVSWKGHAKAVEWLLTDLSTQRFSMRAVGHRVVHGGSFTEAVRITPLVSAQIAALAELAPLHNPPSLEALAAAQRVLPDAKHVAVFDTAFHSTLPPEAYTYPVPAKWTQEWGIRRYGFHGLSHAYCAGRAAEMLGRPLGELRLVICHLGHGCSAAAVMHGKSIDTTMGFTPLDGLMMATRSGAIDPSIVTFVQQRHGLTAREVDHALNHGSGLQGVSGVSADMREVLAAAKAGRATAQLAIGIYTHRIRQAVGALTVTMGGIDALVFTGGVGEHSPEIREQVCVGLECIGLKLDRAANTENHSDSDVAATGSRSRILMIATNEEATMLHDVLMVLGEDRKDNKRTQTTAHKE
ncbi:MAG: acetate/propionate family kinase [Gemmataceae bacterium]